MNGLLGTCLTIFFGRIVDVSLGTLRTMFTVKEKAFRAALCGFGEVFVWFIIVRNALNSDGPVLVLALCYAAGYASGTFIGGKLSKRVWSDAAISSSPFLSITERYALEE